MECKYTSYVSLVRRTDGFWRPTLVREQTEGTNISLMNHCISSLFCNCPYLCKSQGTHFSIEEQISAVKYLLTQLSVSCIH